MIWFLENIEINKKRHLLFSQKKKQNKTIKPDSFVTHAYTHIKRNMIVPEYVFTL